MVKLQPVLKDYLWGGTKLKTLFGRDNGEKIIAESVGDYSALAVAFDGKK